MSPRKLAIILVWWLFGLSGCHMQQARDAATVAVATHGDVLRTYCTAAYDRARTEAEVAAVDARGCPEAADAHDAARAAVLLLDAAIAAGAPDADVAALLADAHTALVDLASAVERVRAGR
jgi:hypothetical protein